MRNAEGIIDLPSDENQYILPEAIVTQLSCEFGPENDVISSKVEKNRTEICKDFCRISHKKSLTDSLLGV